MWEGESSGTLREKWEGAGREGGGEWEELEGAARE
jgi:hypothetical protein